MKIYYHSYDDTEKEFESIKKDFLELCEHSRVDLIQNRIRSMTTRLKNDLKLSNEEIINKYQIMIKELKNETIKEKLNKEINKLQE